MGGKKKARARQRQANKAAGTAYHALAASINNAIQLASRDSDQCGHGEKRGTCESCKNPTPEETFEETCWVMSGVPECLRKLISERPIEKFVEYPNHWFQLDDRLDDLFQYMETMHTMDSKTFAKLMPKFSLEIQQSQISISEATQRVFVAFQVQQNGNDQQIQKVAACRLAYKLVTIGCPSEIFTRDKYLLFESIIVEFALKHGSDYKSFRTAVHCLCIEFNRLLLGGKMPFLGVVLPTCSFKVVHLRDAFFPGLEWFKMWRDVESAIAGIATGVLSIRHSCWECGKVPESKVSVCVKCNFATYCGRKCQKKAWQNIHKETCASLFDKKKKLERDIKTIQKQHSAPDSNTGFVEAMDYWLLSSFGCDTPDIAHLGDLSIERFYRNLGRVRRGELWVTDPTPYDVYKKENVKICIIEASFQAVTDEEVLAFCFISCVLASDLDSTEKIDIDGIAPAFLKFPQIKMPSERFLYLYEKLTPFALPQDYENNWPRHRRFLVKQAEARVREFYEGKVRQACELNEHGECSSSKRKEGLNAWISSGYRFYCRELPFSTKASE